MSFAAPIWLLSLLPWAALSVWLMLGRRQRVEVPFIELWQTTPRPPRELRASLRPPPFALACMLLAMLLGLLAEARPFLRFPLMAHITLIVDRGVTMTGKNAEATVLAAFDATRNELPMLTRVDLLQVPGNLKQTDAWDWWGLLSPATALDTRDSIRNAVQQSVGPTIVVTGNQIDSSDPRVVLFEVPPPSNVGIVHAAARQSPRPALMVRLRNCSQQNTASLRVVADAEKFERSIELPSNGELRDYFFDLPRSPSFISIELVAEDEFAVDNRAWLIRGHAWPKLEARATLSPELQRMIDVYGHHHSPSETSPRVVITDNALRVAATQPAIIVPTTVAPLGSEQIRVVDHPVTANVSFSNASLADAAIATTPDESWTPLVTAGEKVLLAVRENPARQVWVGFNSPAFARQADFVVLWTNVFDWAGGGTDGIDEAEYRCDPVTPDLATWTRLADVSGPSLTAPPSPGVYRSSDGQLRAACALDIAFPQRASDSLVTARQKLSALKSTSPGNADAMDFSSYLLVGALGLIVIAAASWTRQRGGAVATQGLA